jgi:hypothetical protein
VLHYCSLFCFTDDTTYFKDERRRRRASQTVLGGARTGDRVRLEAGTGSVAGFELALKDDCRIGEFLFGEAELWR